MKSKNILPNEGNGRHQFMMAEEEMQRLPRRMQKLSGKSIVV
jgi:hypothetical protein